MATQSRLGANNIPGGQSIYFNGGTLEFTGDGTIGAAGTLTLPADYQLRGAGAVAKTGAGTIVVGGNNVYIGTTEIEAGTLLVHGTHTGGDLYTVHDGATLGGTGAIDATVRVTEGATHAPGASVGHQTVGGEIWDGGGRFEFEINDAAGNAGGPDGWDFLEVAGTLDTSGLTEENPFIIDVVSLAGTEAGLAANFNPTVQYEWPLLSYEDLIGEFDPDLFMLDVGGFQNPLGQGGFELLHIDGGLAIGYIPEPGTWLLLLVAAACGLLVRRRRRW